MSMDSFTPLLDVLEQEKRNLKIMMEINIQACQLDSGHNNVYTTIMG